MAYNSDGGIFGGFLPQDLMRGMSYKQARIPSRKFYSHPWNLLFLERQRDRRWLQKREYLNHLRCHFGPVGVEDPIDVQLLSISQSSMHDLSYEDQVRLFYSTDIVLGGHGSAMTNVMFMTPHSVLINATRRSFMRCVLRTSPFYPVFIT